MNWVSFESSGLAGWVHESLAIGGPLSERMVSREGAGSIAAVVADRATTAMPMSGAHSVGLSVSEANDLLATVLDELALPPGACVVVEDDLALPSDPGLEDAVRVGNAVLRVGTVHPLTGVGPLLRRSSSGYPLNSVVCVRSASELGLLPGSNLGFAALDRCASAAVAVVVAYGDAESFAVWRLR